MKTKNPKYFKVPPVFGVSTVLEYYLRYVLLFKRKRLGIYSLKRKVGYKTFKVKTCDGKGILNTRCSKLVRLKLSFKKYKVSHD